MKERRSTSGVGLGQMMSMSENEVNLLEDEVYRTETGDSAEKVRTRY